MIGSMCFFSVFILYLQSNLGRMAASVVKNVSSGAVLPELVSHLCHFKVCDIEHTM